MARRTDNVPMNATANISIRSAYPDDYSSLWQLAALDDRALPRAPFLVAEQDREIVAAVSLADGATIADPFKHTAEAAALLELRAQQLGAVAA
jgi:hypothetical protein